MTRSIKVSDATMKRIRKSCPAIAWALLALKLLHVAVVAIASAVSTPEVPLRIASNFHLADWLAILLLFVLAQVFLEGTRMREDLEGTI